jgi:hypothetical protein
MTSFYSAYDAKREHAQAEPQDKTSTEWVSWLAAGAVIYAASQVEATAYDIGEYAKQSESIG